MPLMSSKFTVEFRIYGKALDPGAVTELLALEPCQVVLPGTRRGSRIVEEAMWAFNGSEDGEAGQSRMDHVRRRLEKRFGKIVVAARPYCSVQRRQQESLVVRSVSRRLEQRNSTACEFAYGIS